MQPTLTDLPTQTRTRFLRGAVFSGGALAAGGITIGLPRLAASAPSRAQDARILNLVLQLEYLESAFYADAVVKGRLRGELREFAQVVGGHERAHVAFIRKALGTNAGTSPQFDFGDATSSAKRFVASAITIEDTSVGAYNGQAANLTPGTLAAAAKIVSVEARHAAWIRDIAGQPPADDATDAPLTEAQVRRVLDRTGFVKAA